MFFTITRKLSQRKKIPSFDVHHQGMGVSINLLPLLPFQNYFIMNLIIVSDKSRESPTNSVVESTNTESIQKVAEVTLGIRSTI